MIATVNTAQFNAMCSQLAGLSANKLAAVVKSEVTAVLNKTIKNTKIASAAKIRRYGSQFYAVGQDAYSPKRVRRYGSPTKNGYLYYNMTEYRYPNGLWRALVSRRAESRRKKLAARGLARQSWWLVGQSLGLQMEGGSFTTSVPSTGQTYPGNIRSSITGSDSAFNITFSNAQPTVQSPYVGGERALQRAIAGRVKFFETNASKGVFAEVERIGRAYPGIKVNARR